MGYAIQLNMAIHYVISPLCEEVGSRKYYEMELEGPFFVIFCGHIFTKQCLQNALLSFQKLALIEVNESMKLKGSEMGTKMQKIESRSSSFKRENFGKLQQAVGPGDRLQTQLGQLQKLLLLALAVVKQ